MRTLKLVVFILTLSLISNLLASELFSEGFEGAFPGDNWELSGDPTWNDLDDEYHEGSWAAWCAGSELDPSEGRYADEMNAIMSSRPIDLSGVNSAALSFWYKLSSENEYDYLSVNASYYEGRTWIKEELARFSGIDRTGWQQSELSLADYTGIDQVKISFEFITDSSVNNFAGAWIDEVVIKDSFENQTIEDPYEPNNNKDEARNLVFSSTEQTVSASLDNDKDLDWFQFEGIVGREYVIESTGNIDVKVNVVSHDAGELLAENDDGAGNMNFLVKYMPDQEGTYKFYVSGYSGATGNYGIKYHYVEYDMGDADSREPNNNRMQAVRIQPATRVKTESLSIHYPSDEDWFVFQGEPNKIYTFNSTGSLDTEASIWGDDTEGSLMSNDDSGDDTNFEISFTPSESRDYWLAVKSYGTGVGEYDLEYSFREITRDEFESNNTKSTAANLVVSSELQSKDLSLHANDDVDWFKINARTGRVYSLISEGIMDLKAELYGQSNEQMIMSDDDGADGTNFKLEFEVPSNGIYFVKVLPYSETVGVYTLKYSYLEAVGDRYEPDNLASNAKTISFSDTENTQSRTFHYGGDQDWVKFEAREDYSYTIYSTGDLDTTVEILEPDGESSLLTDDDGGEGSNFSITFNVPTAGTYYIKFKPYGGSTGDYQIHYSSHHNPGDDYEPDNTTDDATNLIVSHTVQNQSHSIHSAGDEDWYSIDLQAGREYEFYTEADFDTMGYLYSTDTSDVLVESDDDGSDTNFRIQYTPETSGKYYLRVKGYSSETGNYKLFYR